MYNSTIKIMLIMPLLLTLLPATRAESFSYSGEDVLGSGSYLGVDTRDLTPDRVAALKLKDENGAEVTMVDQDAPAGKAGIKEHDVILSVNGQQVESVEQLRRLIREIPAGREVTLGISRDGQPVTLKAQLAQRHGFGPDGKAFNFKFTVPPMPPMPPMPDIDIPVSIVVVHSSERSGLMVENLSSQLSEFFGAKGGQGILVRSVEKGSGAEKAGFRAGDVIVRINGQPIGDAGDFSRALRNRKENTVGVTILRERKEQTLTLPLPERRQGHVEESFGPEIGVEARKELSEARAELAQMQPQAWRDQAQALAGADKQVEEQWLVKNHELRDEIQQMQRSFQDQRNQLQKQLREWKGRSPEI